MIISVIILMCIVSFELQLPLRIIIHNQCSNTKLVSPVFFGNNAICPKLSGQQVDIGIETRSDFEIEIAQNEFEGALIFKLQIYSDNKYDMDTSTTETNEATCIQMFIAWKVEDISFVHIVLIEHTKEFIWDQDKLRKLYDKNYNWLKKYDSTKSATWQVDDNIILETAFEVNSLPYKLCISISEEKKSDYAMKPLCIDLER
jgi:hypothetical protein